MSENKYFYNNIPLAKYCQDNNINIDTVRTRIWKKKKDPKFKNFTEQQIVNMVIEACGTLIKYRIDGIPLSQYCAENGYDLRKIQSRIAVLKKDNPSLSNDDLVKKALAFDNKNFRFFYHGMPLKEYCKNHPEINYNTIRNFINREKRKHPELSDEELAELYIDKEHKGCYKYYYLGIPLKQYCMENNLNYSSITNYLRTVIETAAYQGLTDDEIVEKVMDEYQPFEPKYKYKELTLREYCLQNNFSYYSVISFVKRGLRKDSTKNIDELIDEGIKTINRYGIIYYYQGIPLVEYAKEHNLNVSSIRGAILRNRLKSDKPLQEIVNHCVESYQKLSIKFFYNNIPLYQYCKKIGLSYNTVIYRYMVEYSDNPNISVEDAIKQIVDNYLEHPPVAIKYCFDNQSLARFCDKNGYPYLAIYRRIKTLESKEDGLNREQIINISIQKYEERLQINKINEFFDKLRKNNISDIDEIKEICVFLKIDFATVLDLINMDFSFNQAINMIWYFSDKKLDNDDRTITDKKIENLLSLANGLKKESINILNIELYDLIGIYKCELYDSRNEILLKLKRYIHKTIFSLCSKYNIKIRGSNYEDFECEIKYYLLLVIHRINLNLYGQIVRYMDLTVKGYFRNYLKKYQSQQQEISLDDAQFISDKKTKKEKARIDYLTDPNNLYEELENTSFSSNMMQVLSQLPPLDLSFIMLKFQENYSNEDLAFYFHLTIEEVEQKEEDILFLLKNNNNLKVLKK